MSWVWDAVSLADMGKEFTKRQNMRHPKNLGIRCYCYECREYRNRHIQLCAERLAELHCPDYVESALKGDIHIADIRHRKTDEDLVWHVTCRDSDVRVIEQVLIRKSWNVMFMLFEMALLYGVDKWRFEQAIKDPKLTFSNGSSITMPQQQYGGIGYFEVCPRCNRPKLGCLCHKLFHKIVDELP